MLDFELQSTVPKINEISLAVWQRDADSPLFNYIDVELPLAPVRWDLEHDVEHQPTADNILTAQAVITDTDFKKFLSESVQIPVDQYTLYRKKSGQVVGGKEIHQYNLILFDRNSSDLRPDHIRIIDSVIAEDGYVLPTSQLRVLGYADSSGTQEINVSLSSERAKNAAARLSARYREVITEANYQEVRGIGSADVLQLPDGQTTPEARFYSRTVFIIVESEPSW
jgi:outer membrane protein OmpA-like peptidoglycan-associated protein